MGALGTWVCRLSACACGRGGRWRCWSDLVLPTSLPPAPPFARSAAPWRKRRRQLAAGRRKARSRWRRTASTATGRRRARRMQRARARHQRALRRRLLQAGRRSTCRPPRRPCPRRHGRRRAQPGLPRVETAERLRCARCRGQEKERRRHPVPLHACDPSSEGPRPWDLLLIPLNC